MERLFGLPMGGLATGVAIALGLAGVVVLGLAARNPVFARLAVRSAVRRRARTALILVGLMLATTIIASALVTGDTMSTTLRSSTLETLGDTDEVVAVRGVEEDLATVELGGATAAEYLLEDVVDRVVGEAGEIDLVDAAVPSISEPVAVQDTTSRRNEPSVMLFAAESEPFTHLQTIRSNGQEVTLDELGDDEAFLNADAADELQARAGDELVVFVAGGPRNLRVRALVEVDGTGTDGPGMLVSIPTAQDLLGREGRVENVLISNRGDDVSGSNHTDEVTAALQSELVGQGLEVDTVKQDGLDEADAQGNAFMGLFTTFGTFSIAAGVLLVFLIFVMLAAERRPELGVARAIGTRRGHLVQLFVFEGTFYAVLAAAVGVLLGVVVAFGMVTVVGKALGSGIEVKRSVQIPSLVVAYGFGVLLTLGVVAVSAWRVSVLNIVTAVRNLPEPATTPTGRRRWAAPAVLGVLGALMTSSGAGADEAMPFMLGISLLLLAVVLLARRLGAPQRATFTVGGVLLLTWWLLPFTVIRAILDEPAMDFSIWIVAGLMAVLGTTWIVMNNADSILRLGLLLGRRLGSLIPVIKMAGAYPLRNRFRTGVTFAMFTLVVFTLVTGGAISNSFTQALNDVDQFGGGFDIRAGTSPVAPIPDMAAAIRNTDGLDPEDFTAIGSQSLVPVTAHQNDTPGAPDPYIVRGLDDGFLEANQYGFGAMAEGYDSAEEIWHALETQEDLAIVDSFAVPRRSNFGFGLPPDFQVSGFYAEDETFEPVSVRIHHPQSRIQLDLTIIGVLADSAPYDMAGITTSARTLHAFRDLAQPTTHFFQLAPGVDADRTAAALEEAFLANGTEAESFTAILDEAVGSSLTFQRLVMGFMGLGLVVGVAALGVVGARAVVERRQQIGVLRAVGFRPEMVRLSFLLEAGVLAGSAIIVGAGLGLVMAYNVVEDSARQPAWDQLHLIVPWVSLVIVFATVFVAAMAATYAPARRASRVYPAEALRYE